jgi:hypothetical protein
LLVPQPEDLHRQLTRADPVVPGTGEAALAGRGLPVALNIDAIEFSGGDDDGKHKQRAFRVDELRRLFREVLAPFRFNPATEHRWWLPPLAFFRGARVNELAQLNPQTDVAYPDGIPYLLITEGTEADEAVWKSVRRACSGRFACTRI